MAVLGFDLSPLRSAITELGQGVRQGVQQQQPGGGDSSYLGYLSSLTPPPEAASQMLGQIGQRIGPALAAGSSGDYLGQLGQYAQQRLATSPATDYLANLATFGMPQAANDAANQMWNSLGSYGNALANQPTGIGKGAAAVAAAATNAAAHGGGGPSTGLEPDVAKWGNQTQATFGDILDPDIMLAIMTNESHGQPTAYNVKGNARGLFQQVGLGSNDPNVQFQAARQLAQEKLAGINAAYQKNGLNPDARTRALDFAAAWGGHFDYGSGRFNPNSYDPGVNQTGQQWADVFLGNYDKIKAGRPQAASGGSTGMGGITPGVGGQIMQEFGVTDTSNGYLAAGNHVYDYGSAYGMAGGGHPGVDWAVPRGSRVATPLGGTVSVVGNDHGSGYYYQDTGNPDRDHSGEFAITLANGDILILGHLSHINAQVGQQLNAGTLIGASGGSDGDHVHVEYRRRNADGSYTVVDPRTMLGG